MATKEEFIKQEQASQDTIDVKRIYIDIAGDLITGIFLSQLIHWHLPSKKHSKDTKLMIFDRTGKGWLAKKRTDWWDECRLTPRQVDRSLKILKEKGLIYTKIKKFKGEPQIHIHFRFEIFLPLWEKYLNLDYEDNDENTDPDLPIGESGLPESVNPDCLKGEIQIASKSESGLPVSGNPLNTKITTKTTTKTTFSLPTGKVKKRLFEDLFDFPRGEEENRMLEELNTFMQRVQIRGRGTKESKIKKRMILLDTWIKASSLEIMYKVMKIIESQIAIGMYSDSLTQNFVLTALLKEIPDTAIEINQDESNKITYRCKCGNLIVPKDELTKCPICNLDIRWDLIYNFTGGEEVNFAQNT
ncbi:MAG TPA: hypothetical protein P5136_00275 [Methanofastidiosum sp.]|nr:hypothetical protein [Methanofastidiosum sp.]